MRAASVFYNGMFTSDDFVVPKQVIYKKNLPTDTEFHQELKMFMSDEDMLAAEISIDNQMYKNGDLIVVEVTDSDSMKVGLVQSILVKDGKVFFVCKLYQCVRNFLQYFESTSCDEFCSFVESKNICDYKPLIKRGTPQKFIYFLHHRVSFAYN